ncbi:hypothetical protein GQR58_015853 [Nymphon striatum]|nr:hypothetical protein GQR58_015853 [Nymphon striatum]
MPTGCCVPICKNRSGHSFPLSNPARSENAIFSVSCGNSSKMPKVQNVLLIPHFDLSNKIMSSVRFISHFIVHFLHIFSLYLSTWSKATFPIRMLAFIKSKQLFNPSTANIDNINSENINLSKLAWFNQLNLYIKLNIGFYFIKKYYS